MKNSFKRVLRRLGPLLMIITLIFGSLVPSSNRFDFAQVDQLSLVSSVTVNGANTTVVKPEDSVEVNLDYSTVSMENHFYNVTVDYTLPVGAVYTGVVESGHVKAVKLMDGLGNDVTGDASKITTVKKIQFSLRNKETDTSLDTQFKAGSSGSVKVKFKFPSPSVYTNGTIINLTPGTISGNAGTEAGVLVTAASVASTLTYNLDKSWTIEKTGPTELIISNSPAQTFISATYNIKLLNGNIPLKDVVITDTLPADAEFVSTTLNTSPGIVLDTATPGKVIWKLDDVPVAGKNFNITIKYAVKRGASAGVVAGDSRTNTVHVLGYPVGMQADGSFAKVVDPQADAILNNEATATTTFKASTAKWGVETKGPAVVYLSQNPLETSVDVPYTIKVSGGDIDINNGVLTYTLPNDVSAVTASDGGTVNLSNHTITWTGLTLSANGTLNKAITLKYPIDRTAPYDSGVWDQSKRNHVVTVAATDALDSTTPVDFAPATDSVETTFIVSVDRWTINKSGPGSVIVKNDAADGEPGGNYYDVTYNINLSGSQYTTPLKNVDIMDTLPANGAYVSNTSGSEPTISGNKLTWHYSDLQSPGKSFNVVVRYTIDRDGTGPVTGYVPGMSVSNVVEVKADKIDASGNPDGSYSFPGGGKDTATTGFNSAATPNPAVTINIAKAAPDTGVYSKDGSKLIQNKNFNKGEMITYEMSFNNNNHRNEVLYNTEVVVNNLPSDIQYTELRLGKGNADLAYELYYTVDGTHWISAPLTNLRTGQNGTLNLANSLPGVNIKGFKYVFADNIPTGFDLTEKILLVGQVKNTATNIRYDARIDLNFKNRVFQGISNINNRNDLVGFEMLWDEAWISNMNKTMVTPYSSGGGHTANKDVTYQLTLTNHSGLGTKDLLNPVLVDVLPAGFEYKGNVTFTSSLGAAGLTTPTQVIKKNYPDQGQTTVYFSWPAGTVLKIGETITLRYDTKVMSYAGVGTHYNKFYLYASEAFRYGSGPTPVIDEKLNATDTHGLIQAPPLGTVVLETAAIESVLWVKGELDADYSKFPTVGRTVRGGIADYRLEVQNVSNIHAKEIEVVDILPFVGDTNVTDTTARNSKWRPYMIEAIASGYLDGLVTDVYGNKSKANLTVYYSLAKDPVRENQLGNTIGTEAPNWTVVPPTDMSTVQSLKFVVNDFEENGKANRLLKPGSKISISWKMRAPIDTASGLAAWNSISQTATIVELNDNTRKLLGAVPLKVGIDVEPSVKGELGDYVWLDANKNGIQEAGEAGINGVRVSLYKKVAGNFVLDKTTLTGDNQSGKSGYYLFPNLDAGDYYVAFDIKGLGYEPTLRGKGTPDLDSNGYYDGTLLRSENITLGNGVKNPTVDLGLFESNFVITKTADAVNFSSAGAVVNYTIKVVNNGPVDLTKVVVKDALIKLNETIPVLKVDEFKIYTGTYTTTVGDVTAGKVNNIAYADSDQTPEISATKVIPYTPPSSGGGGGGGGVPPVTPPVTPPVVPPVTPPTVPPVTPIPPTTPPGPGTTVDTKKDTVKIIDENIPKGPVVVTQPANGKVKKDDQGKWIYVPNPGFVGVDKFVITTTLPDGTKKVETITINVDETPLGAPKWPSIKTLPKTGETETGWYYAFGGLLIALGLFLLRTTGTKK